jgi:hypothetical protein
VAQGALHIALSTCTWISWVEEYVMEGSDKESSRRWDELGAVGPSTESKLHHIDVVGRVGMEMLNLVEMEEYHLHRRNLL